MLLWTCEVERVQLSVFLEQKHFHDKRNCPPVHQLPNTRHFELCRNFAVRSHSSSHSLHLLYTVYSLLHVFVSFVPHVVRFSSIFAQPKGEKKTEAKMNRYEQWGNMETNSRLMLSVSGAFFLCSLWLMKPCIDETVCFFFVFSSRGKPFTLIDAAEDLVAQDKVKAYSANCDPFSCSWDWRKINKWIPNQTEFLRAIVNTHTLACTLYFIKLSVLSHRHEEILIIRLSYPWEIINNYSRMNWVICGVAVE